MNTLNHPIHQPTSNQQPPPRHVLIVPGGDQNHQTSSAHQEEGDLQQEGHPERLPKKTKTPVKLEKSMKNDENSYDSVWTPKIEEYLGHDEHHGQLWFVVSVFRHLCGGCYSTVLLKNIYIYPMDPNTV